MNIYIVCAWYEVGIRHYSFNVLSNINKYLPKNYNVYVTLVLRKDIENYPELKELDGLKVNYIVIKNKYANILSKAFPFFFDHYIQNRIKKYNASLLYILFEGFFFKNIDQIKKSSRVLYTIHDLIPHEKNKTNWKEKWLSRVENNRAKYLLNISDYILTNSSEQYETLKNLFKKSVFYLNMPTLINSHIANGDKMPEELHEKCYILFFGRIDKYKGLDKLVECHLNSNSNMVLVIAGAGNIWFKIAVTEKIIIINRHIDDSEIKYLFENAFCCVLPYISVTQTALVSIPFYFKCPVILSDIENFMRVAEHSGSLICDFQNKDEYSRNIQNLGNKDFREDIIKRQCDYYVANYDPEFFANNLRKIFDETQRAVEF